MTDVDAANCANAAAAVAEQDLSFKVGVVNAANEETGTTAVKKESSETCETIDPLSYLKRDEFTSERFKIEIRFYISDTCATCVSSGD